MDEDRARYLDIEQMVKREQRDAERVYIYIIEDHKILTDLQHGFRSGRSCETQYEIVP